MTEDDRYSRGKIYKLIENSTGLFYIGSTCMPLHKRFYDHKGRSKKEPNRKVYQYFTYDKFVIW